MTRTIGRTSILVWLLLAAYATAQPNDVEADDCTPCCQDTTDQIRPSCCDYDSGRNLYGTAYGECSGLPCCSYGGRKAQNHQAWYPCLLFPTCASNGQKRDLCEAQSLWYYTEGDEYKCTDDCCSPSQALDSNVWRGVTNSMPGQLNATFSVSFNPSDYLPIFYPNSNDTKPLSQIVLASPEHYAFQKIDGQAPRCTIGSSTTFLSADATQMECGVAIYNNRSYLTMSIPDEYQTSKSTFIVSFDQVVTPSGQQPPTKVFSTNSSLTPVYFLFDDDQSTAFASYVIVTGLSSATLSSGAFLPDNVYPGNTGAGTLLFYTNARAASGSSIELDFSSDWGFEASATWSWEVEADALSSGNKSSALTKQRPFEKQTFNSRKNRWKLELADAIEAGWVVLTVDKVQNPSIQYSGLNMASVSLVDAEDHLIVSGSFSSITVDSTDDSSFSPYNYVSLVVLVGSFLFCFIVIRKNGLSFSLGSIWTDLTAICTLAALLVAIVNNLLWLLLRSSAYFYISRAHLCLTFTMLLAVCFHWGTVLSLRLRKLPKRTTTLAFVLLNALFYAFQIVFLIIHRHLIRRVYDSERDPASYANQQCKRRDVDRTATVFSDIQGFLWRCYAQDEAEFFLTSSTVTTGIFLALTIAVMALGIMVMRRGKTVLGNATGAHQAVLVRALRLYYTLIGVVTLVYLISWVLQLLSRRTGLVSYPAFYIFTVWLPYSIPPCCLIFLQWNATTRTLRDVDEDDHSPGNEWGYGEIRTPSLVFSTADRWSVKMEDEFEDDIMIGAAGMSTTVLSTASSGANRIDSCIGEDYMGLSMALETSEKYPHGCFIGLQRMGAVDDRASMVGSWRQISHTDTVEASVKEGSPDDGIRYQYSFLSVPRVPVSSRDENLRLVVYAVSDVEEGESQSDMTASRVLAALEQAGSDDTQSQSRELDGSHSTTHTHDSSLADQNAWVTSQVIDDLFDLESESDSADGETAGIQTRVVAEFTVDVGTLLSSGTKGQPTDVSATTDSYQLSDPEASPPRLSVHSVVPNTSSSPAGAAPPSGGLAPTPAISSQYHLREKALLVVEDLSESRFSNLIPRQVLEVIIKHRSKDLLIAQNDLAQLEAFDRARQKGSDRGIYENLIQQIQDDGDIARCREWMLRRCEQRKEYLELLRRLRRVYVSRDQNKTYFKPSTEKKNAALRFLPINLHLQEMWVGKAHSWVDAHGPEPVPGVDDAGHGRTSVYDVVTVGAMAAHVYKFKSGGILGMEETFDKHKPRAREHMPGAHQDPLWTEEQQKADEFEWELQQRMDVCFPQAVATLVTAFTRKVDFMLQSNDDGRAKVELDRLAKLGFLLNVESLVSTHGNEVGMLEDMAGAVNELRNVRLVLVEDEVEGSEASNSPVSLRSEEEEQKLQSMPLQNPPSSHASSVSTIAGVVDVDVFMSLDDALSETSSNMSHRMSNPTNDVAEPPSPTNSQVGVNTSITGVGQRLLSTIMNTKPGKKFKSGNDIYPPSLAPSSADNLFDHSRLVIRVKVRSNKVKLPDTLRHGNTIGVWPVLFTQGINEKQTLANNTGSSLTKLQDEINEHSLKVLRSYCDRYSNFMAATGLPSVPSRVEIMQTLGEVQKLISASKQARRKRPEILQLTSDLCRKMAGGRVTVCKSAKDRTSMSVTLEQGRILVQNHGLPEDKVAGIVSVMRSEGVRIENALKNTGRRVFAFNALQRSLLPEEYRCPTQTSGRNIS